MIALLANSFERGSLQLQGRGKPSILLCIRRKQYLGSFQYKKHFKILILNIWLYMLSSVNSLERVFLIHKGKLLVGTAWQSSPGYRGATCELSKFQAETFRIHSIFCILSVQGFPLITGDCNLTQAGEKQITFQYSHSLRKIIRKI